MPDSSQSPTSKTFSLSDADQEMLEAIQSGGQAQEKAIKKLYQQYFHLTYESRRKYYQLDSDELVTAYNNAILSLRRAIVEKRFKGNASLWTYLNSIFRNCCIDIIRRRTSNTMDAVDNLPEMADDQQNIFYQLGLKQEFDQALNLLNKVGEICKQIILDSEYWGYSSEEIAHRIGYGSAKSVNSKKYTCLKKLQNLLEGKNKKKE